MIKVLMGSLLQIHTYTLPLNFGDVDIGYIILNFPFTAAEHIPAVNLGIIDVPTGIIITLRKAEYRIMIDIPPVFKRAEAIALLQVSDNNAREC